VGCVACVLAMMILPLEAWILDFLLAINMVGSVTLLLVTLSISDSMKLATFPTLLLISTLFRLGLNLASTRLVLGYGYAGHIIETFGNFATGGNLLVGFVMFLILTIIQFVVVAKGAERVAEVSARFTLDALPGRQMSIDADLRAGLLGQEEAKKLRDDLHRESKMYGGMDGAMKFVKGDTIASLLIAGINLLGGMGTGMVQRGLSFKESVQTYSLLTIGDSLVNQIPALLVALTAGFIVTRVSDEKKENSLGKDIGQQILSQPRALLTGAFLSLGMGFFPGFPLFFFGLLSAGLAWVAVTILKKIKQETSAPLPVDAYKVEDENQRAEKIGLPTPLALEVGYELYQVFTQDPRWVHFFGQLYPKLRVHLTNQMGVVFPELKLIVNVALSKSFKYRLRVFEVPVDTGLLNPHHCTMIGEVPNRDKNITGQIPESGQTMHGTPISLWNLKEKESLAREGLNTLGPEEMLLRHLKRILKKHAGDFVGIQEMRHMLSRVEIQYPELVREVVPKVMSIQKLTEVVKRLVEEGIPIKDFRLILQILSCNQPENKDPVTLTEYVRMGLKRTITFMHVQEGSRLGVAILDDKLEDEIRSGIQTNGSESYLVLSPDRLTQINLAIINFFQKENINSRYCILLTLPDIRRYVKKITEHDLPELAVLSFQELDPKIVIEQKGIIRMEENPWLDD